MTENEKKQVEMHRNFFVQCESVIQKGYYLEAILMEYAAIESRLESICGVLGFPCGKMCNNKQDIKISSRIECLRVYRNKSITIFSKSKLPKNFFTKNGELRLWIKKRDCRVHGLFKNEEEFEKRIEENEELARQGYEYAKLLYNEAKRIRRLRKNHNDVFASAVAACKRNNCFRSGND